MTYQPQAVGGAPARSMWMAQVEYAMPFGVPNYNAYALGPSVSNLDNRYVVSNTGTINNLRVLVSGVNTLNGQAVVTLVKNGLFTTLTVTIPAGAGGQFTDVVNSVSVVAGDWVYWIINTAAAGAGLIGINTLRPTVDFIAG